MYPFETVGWVFLGITLFAFAINIWWLIRNILDRREVRGNLRIAQEIKNHAENEALAIRRKAVNDVLEFRAGEFKVCSGCGKIIQGVCLDCVANISA